MKIRSKSVFFLGFSLLSALLFMVELSVYSRTASNARLTAPTAGKNWITTGFSSSAQNGVLRSCDRFLSLPIAQLLTENDLLETTAACLSISRSLSFWMPTNGLAYLVAARASTGGTNMVAKIRLIELSQSFSPVEGWLSERRFTLIANSNDSETFDSFRLIEPDIATLLTTQSGAELLAAFYIRRAGIRSDLSLAVSKASSANQIRFVNQIRLQGMRE